jgi:hypothetical protein
MIMTYGLLSAIKAMSPGGKTCCSYGRCVTSTNSNFPSYRMPSRPFDLQEHVYRNDAFAELVKDGVRFFNGTPVLELPPPERFCGTGVYAIYYTGQSPLYAKYGELNRLSYGYPIYVGKAVPKGWRQARTSHLKTDRSTELYNRLRQHGHGIAKISDLNPKDFMCRFVIFEGDGSDMISTVEAALIKITQPLWNTVVDGFGNHTPGKGRFEQARSAWDVIHPGRVWADKCKGIAAKPEVVIERIKKHLSTLGGSVV